MIQRSKLKSRFGSYVVEPVVHQHHRCFHKKTSYVVTISSKIKRARSLPDLQEIKNLFDETKRLTADKMQQQQQQTQKQSQQPELQAQEAQQQEQEQEQQEQKQQEREREQPQTETQSQAQNETQKLDQSHPSDSVTSISISRISRTLGGSAFLEQQRKANEHRRRIALELLETEMFYVGSLNTVDVHFIKALRALEGQQTSPPIIPEVVRRQIFANWTKILKFNRQLMEELQNRTENWSNTSILSDVFNDQRMRSFVSLYCRYINNYSQGFTVYKDHQSNPNFRNFIKQSVQKSGLERGQRLNLEDYLIMPVQRIPRYVLLLEQLLRVTPPSHPDYNGLDYSHKQFKLVAEIVNISKKHYDDENEVKKVLSEIVDFPHDKLERTSLSVVHEGFLNRQGQKVYIVLLNKFLILCKIAKNGVHQFSELLPIKDLEAFVTKTPEASSIVIKSPSITTSPLSSSSSILGMNSNNNNSNGTTNHGQIYHLTHESLENIIDWHKYISQTSFNLIAQQEDLPTDLNLSDPKLEIVELFVNKEANYLSNLKRLYHVVKDFPDKQMEDFFSSIEKIITKSDALYDKIVERFIDPFKKKAMGDIFEANMKELIDAYYPYWYAWAELQYIFSEKRSHPGFLACITQFESSYGDSVEKFFESISDHPLEISVVTKDLQNHTNKNISFTDYTSLEKVTDLLQKASDKITRLREFNSDHHRTSSDTGKKKKPKNLNSNNNGGGGGAGGGGGGGGDNCKKGFDRLSLKW